MNASEYPAWFLERITHIKSKRPRTVAQHILAHGHITTEELTTLYGYQHAPRAARDLRELGIPLETVRVKNSDGRTIAAYRFGDLATIREDRLSGRQVFSKQFKQQLIARDGSRCSICGGEFEARYLQIDHRIPYEVIGNQAAEPLDIHDYQLLCGTCNRAKSWSCEHCANWFEYKQTSHCMGCYWAFPHEYTHVALMPVRRADLVWLGDDVLDYDQLAENALAAGERVPDFMKRILRQVLGHE